MQSPKTSKKMWVLIFALLATPVLSPAEVYRYPSVSGGGGGGGGAPTGAAGGDLGGAYPDPTVTQARGLRESGGTTLSMATVADGELLYRTGSTVDGIAIGSSAGTIAAGNDARFTDSRAPSGSAGGVLSGTYPNPSLAASNSVAVTWSGAQIYSAATTHNGTTAILGGLSVTAGADTLTLGTWLDGQRLTRNGSSIAGAWNADRLTVYEAEDEFVQSFGTGIGILNWAVTQGVTGSAAQMVGTTYVDQDHPGMVELLQGNNAAGYVAISWGNQGAGQFLAPASGTARSLNFCATWRSAILSDATNEFTGRWGFSDSTSNAAPTDGIWVDYSSAAPNSGNYNLNASSNGTTTRVDLGVTPTAAQFERVCIAITNGVATATINGTAITGATISTNLPTGSSRQFGVVIANIKTAGTTPRGITLDRVVVRQVTQRNF